MTREERVRRKIAGLGLAVVVLSMVSSCGWIAVDSPRTAGLGCTRSSFLPYFDLALAIGGGIALTKTGVADKQPSTMAAPATFAVTGLWGRYKVFQCRSRWEKATPQEIAEYQAAVAAYNAQRERELEAERQRQQQLAAAQAAAAARCTGGSFLGADGGCYCAAGTRWNGAVCVGAAQAPPAAPPPPPAATVSDLCYDFDCNGSRSGKQCFKTRADYCSTLCASSNCLAAMACKSNCR